jgi:hypothetical protein
VHEHRVSFVFIIKIILNCLPGEPQETRRAYNPLPVATPVTHVERLVTMPIWSGMSVTALFFLLKAI